ncbi:MAG: hypothetical protein R2695_01690 [Acidimicrobiales bacterium]
MEQAAAVAELDGPRAEAWASDLCDRAVILDDPDPIGSSGRCAS